MAECICIYAVFPRADVKSETSTDVHTLMSWQSTQCTESKYLHLPMTERSMAELELINIYGACGFVLRRVMEKNGQCSRPVIASTDCAHDVNTHISL